MVKLLWPLPLTIGLIGNVPALGPTEVGVLVQLSPTTYVPVNAQADGVFMDPSKGADPLPAVAVTGALLIVYDPLTGVTSKLVRAVAPGTGMMVVVPSAGPTDAGAALGTTTI